MQQIIRHLFKAETLEDVPRQRLEELIEEHPSFSIGHYLLSKKLKAEQAEHFAEETQRTNLYFTNPFWLHWLLEGKGEDKGWPPRSAEAEKILAAEKEVAREKEIARENGIGVEEDIGVENKVAGGNISGNIPETSPTDIHETEDIPAAGDGALIAMGEVASFGDLPSEARAEEAQEIVEYPAEEGSSEETVAHVPPEEQHFRESLSQPADAPAEHAVAPQETAIFAQPAPEMQPASEVQHAPEVQPAPEVWPAPEVQPAKEPEPLVFQSYHTIDYFASQGIKLSLDENQNPSDRLGMQLKSFTEWLKVMKKLPKKEEDVKPDAIAEQKIQAIAAHSLEEREVVTETMAEVLAKQGMWQKAAEVYHKLSLLNPDKSAYFAGLIGQMQARSNEQINTN